MLQNSEEGYLDHELTFDCHGKKVWRKSGRKSDAMWKIWKSIITDKNDF